MSQHKQPNQTQIALGVVVNQKQEMEFSDEQMTVQDFIEIITRSFEHSEVFDENTITMTQGELEDKLKVASGQVFRTYDIISSMKAAGFEMQVISTALIQPDFYWLLKPKRTIKN